MSLDELHDIRVWHLRHVREHPLEKHAFDMVLTLWLTGWVGAPAAAMIHAGWALGACACLFFLPGSYVALRRRLHRAKLLRCDWIRAVGPRR